VWQAGSMGWAGHWARRGGGVTAAWDVGDVAVVVTTGEEGGVIWLICSVICVRGGVACNCWVELS
jgi:hypothetical protein